MGGGAESGGNLKTDHEGKSGVCRDGPAPDMMGVWIPRACAGDESWVEDRGVGVVGVVDGRHTLVTFSR